MRYSWSSIQYQMDTSNTRLKDFATLELFWIPHRGGPPLYIWDRGCPPPTYIWDGGCPPPPIYVRWGLNGGIISSGGAGFHLQVLDRGGGGDSSPKGRVGDVM